MTKKNFCGPKVKVKVKVNSLGRPLRFRYLLLQFLTDLDNSGGILFVIGWTTIALTRIFNFYLITKRPRLKVCKFYFSQISELNGSHFVIR